MVKRLLILLLFMFFGTLQGSLVFAADVQAIADRDHIAFGESLLLELRLNGSPDSEPDFSSLERDWEILNRSQSSQMQFINGNFKRSVVYSLNLMARKTGELNIPAICFGADCSQPLPIEVATQAAANQGREDQPILLETELIPQSAVSQSQLLLKVKLLRRVDLLQGSLSEPQPAGVDTQVIKLGDDLSYETRRNGQRYLVIERDYALFPQFSGTLNIPPIRFDGSISDGRSRFGSLGQRGRQVRLFSDELTLEVEAPPSDLHGRPWLPAQSLTLTDDWQGRELKLKVGEPATRTLTLRVQGLPAAQLPELKLVLPEGFKSYPDQPLREDRQTAEGITGSLQQKIALVPTRAGRHQLPAIDLDWWDVSQQRWQRAHLAAVMIDVVPAEETAGTLLPPPVPTINNTPAPLPPASSEEYAEGPPLRTVDTGVSEFWPWFSLVLGCGWLLTLVLCWKRRQRPTESKPKEETVAPKEREMRQAVLRAARENDARATRSALLGWCRTLWPQNQNAGIETLRQAAGPTLRQALEELDRSLYRNAETGWDGSALAQQVADWESASVSESPKVLPSLYP